MENKNNIKCPWPGVLPYAENDGNLFHGRDEEINELAGLINRNVCTTLYGMSGTGKSSLLKAGLFPILRKGNFLPIYIRLKTEAESSFQKCLIEAVQNQLREQNFVSETIPVVEMLKDENSLKYLWCWFARTLFKTAKGEEGKELCPVIVLDQFEELLNDSAYSEKAEILLNQIYYMMDNSHALRDRIIEIEGLEDPYEYKYKENFRFVISIREDDLYLLEDSIDKNYLYRMKNCRYRLRNLSPKGAMEVVRLPGKDVFMEEDIDEIAKKIVNEVSDKDEINPMILSLLCSRIYDSFYKNHDDSSRISFKDIDDYNTKDILKRYFGEVTAGLSKDEWKILDDFADSYGRRVTIPSSDVPQRIIDLLSDKLIRKNGDNIELIHDQFGPILAEGKRQRETIRFRQDRNKKIIGIISLLILVLIIGIIAFYSAKLKKAKERAQAIAISYAARILNDKGDNYTAQLVLLEQLLSNRENSPEIEVEFRNAHSNPSHIINTSAHVRQLCFSPNGKIFVTASDDGKVIFWNTREGIPIDTIQAYDSYVFYVQMNVEGTLLATSNGHDVKIWDIRTKRHKQTIVPHRGFITSISFSPNNKQIVTAAIDNSEAGSKYLTCIWDTETGDSVASLREAYYGGSWAEYSPDGKMIIGGDVSSEVKDYRRSLFGGEITIPGPVTKFWDAKTKTPIKILKVSGDQNRFSPDRNRFLSKEDRLVKIWDVNADTIVNTLRGHTSWIRSASYSSDGKYILTASDDKTVKVWDATTCLQKDSLKGTGEVLDARFSPNGKTIVASFGDRTIRIWDIEVNAPNIVLGGQDGWNGQSKVFVEASNGKIVDSVYYLKGFLAYSPDGKFIANASSDADVCIRIWNAQTGEFYRKLKTQNDYFSSHLLTFNPNGKRLADVNGDKIRVWDVENGKIINEICYKKGGGRVMSSIAFSPDSKQIAYTRGDSVFHIWNWEHNKLDSIMLRGCRGNINNAIFSPDGQSIAVETDDIIIVDKYSKKMKKIIKRDAGGGSISYSSNGRFLLSPDFNSVVVWDLEKGKEYKRLHSEESGYYEVLFSPDENYVWARGYDFFVVWHLNSGLIVENRQMLNQSPIYRKWKQIRLNGNFWSSSESLHFFTAISPKGHQFAFTDGYTIMLWNQATLQELIDKTRHRFVNRKLTREERQMYYLDK